MSAAPIPRPNRRNARTPHYTPQQDAILRDLYPAAPKHQLLAALPGRTWLAIYGRAARLGISRHAGTDSTRWRKADLEAVRTHYEARGPQWLAQLLNHPVGAVTKAARRLGLPPYQRPPALPRVRKPRPARPPRPVAVKAPRPPKEPRPPRTKAPAPPKLGRATLVLPPPQPRSPATPQLNASRAARQASEKAAKQKPPGHVSADMIRALPAAHPARLAFTKAAYHGPAAAAAAYHEAMKLAA